MISVIIPIFDVEDNLYTCLNSVLKQTYQDFEIICVVDGSSDSSLEILNYFTKKDSRVKIIKNDFHCGLGYSRNHGLEIATGKYVFFLDATDWISFDTFEILVKTAEKENLDVLMFNNIIYDDKNQTFTTDDPYDIEFKNSYENKIFNHFELEKNKIFSIPSFSSNKFFLKSFLDQNNIWFPNENLIFEEEPFFYNVILSANRISFIDKPFYTMRKRLEPLNERLFDTFDICYSILNVFLENPQIYKYYKTELLNYIFKTMLWEKYCQIKEDFKMEFFKHAQNLISNIILNYELYEDIIESIDSEILNKFNFKKIIENLKNLPKLSIIISVYNKYEHLPNLLNSILNQSMDFNDLEIILVDDCSTDGSSQLIDDYSKKYDNIKSLHLFYNSGSPSKPRNIGIKSALSKYIIFQDADDILDLNACEILYDTINKENVDIVGGMNRTNNEGNGYQMDYNPWISIFDNFEGFEKRDAMEILSSKELFKFKIDSIDEHPIMLKDYSFSSKIYKKSLFFKNKIKFIEYFGGGEDTAFLFHSLIKAKGIIFINKPIFDYNRLVDNSLSKDLSLNIIKSRPKAYKYMYDLAISNNKKDFFIEYILGNKIAYWIKFHLLKSNIPYEELFYIFESYQILFIECINYNLNMPSFIKELCLDIKNNDIDRAVLKVIENLDS